MILKIQAIILSVMLFFIGIIYGDKPVEIEYTVRLSTTEISVEEILRPDRSGGGISVGCSCENVGRPFEGYDFYGPAVSFYKIEDGEKVYLPISYIVVDAVSQPKIIKSGEKFDISSSLLIEKDAEPGVYTLEVSVYGCEQIYEDILVLK